VHIGHPVLSGMFKLARRKKVFATNPATDASKFYAIVKPKGRV